MWTVGGTAVGASDGRSSTRRPSWARVRDLVVVALGVVGAGSLLVGEGPLADLGVWTWLEALGTLTVAVALWWRRSHPVGVALLGCAVGAAGGSWIPVWFRPGG